MTAGSTSTRPQRGVRAFSKFRGDLWSARHVPSLFFLFFYFFLAFLAGSTALYQKLPKSFTKMGWH